MKNTLNNSIKAVIFKLSRISLIFHGVQYVALISGFAIFAPILQVYSDEMPREVSAGSTLAISIPQKTKVEIYERVITAYSSTPEETDETPFITASGSYVRFGIVAANWLPIGTTIRIPELYGDQVFVVLDRMNKKHPDKVDIWLPSKEAALNFGKRLTKVEVI